MPPTDVLATLLLFGLVAVAAYTDAARHRIYNWTTYPGILAGLALAAGGWLFELAAPSAASDWRQTVGWLPIGDALAGFFVCGVIMLVAFVLFPIGGGDVKLLAMIGALAGLSRGLEVLLWTFIFGGCFGLIVLIWKLGALALVKRAGQLLLGIVSLGIWLRPPAEERETLKLPVFLGPCAALALVATFVPWH
jgi:prepilin peptidase CpaA